MNDFSFDWPSSASQLVSQAQIGVDLAKLIMEGTSAVCSWLIANRILPVLREKGLNTLSFCRDAHREKHFAACIPLPDGSAFVCNVLGEWLPFEKEEATHEMQYIGARYAPGDHWLNGFTVALTSPDGTSTPLTPRQMAAFWGQLTGVSLSGFETGVFDHLEVIGHSVVDKVFTTQGRLGL